MKKKEEEQKTKAYTELTTQRSIPSEQFGMKLVAYTYKKSFEFMQIIQPIELSKVLTINKSGLEDDSQVTNAKGKNKEGKITDNSTIVLFDCPTIIAYPSSANLRHLNYVHNGYRDEDNRANVARNTWGEEMRRANIKIERDFNMVRVLMTENIKVIKKMKEEKRARDNELIRIINKIYSRKPISKVQQ